MMNRKNYAHDKSTEIEKKTDWLWVSSMPKDVVAQADTIEAIIKGGEGTKQKKTNATEIK